MRAVKLCKGENLAGALRRFTASRNLWDAGATPVTGTVSEGTKDMDSGERESVTEGAESPRDVAASMTLHEDAGKTDSAEDDLKGKPVAQVGMEKVRENLAGSQP